MKTLNLTLVILFLSGGLFAQNTNSNCGTIPKTQEQKEQQRHYGNNKMLIGVLNKHGFDIPSDYFAKIDNRGLYKGGKVSRKKVKGTGNSEGGRVAFSGGITYVPVAIHIYRNDAGTLAASIADVYEEFELMVQQFRENESSIEPFVKSIGIANYNQHYNISNAVEVGVMFTLTRDPNAYNVHIVNDSYTRGSADLGGKSSHLSVANGGLNPITFAHELGHNFNLQHTHDGGLLQDFNRDCIKCDQEPVSRTRTNKFGCLGVGKRKCETNGDELSDTPGDPVTVTCALPGGTDRWGDTWQPDLSNIMSYSGCRTTFSLGQIGVMLDELDTRSYVSNSTNYSISGASQLCQGSVGTYTSSYSNSFLSPIWQVPTGWTITSGQGTNTITVVAGAGTGNIYVTAYGAAVSSKSVSAITASGGTVSGPSSVYKNSYGLNYSTAGMSGATYSWSVPSGWTISSGQGGSSILAATNSVAMAGYVEVAVNVCGSSVTRYKYVSISSSGGGGDPCTPQLAFSSSMQEQSNSRVVAMKVIDPCLSSITTNIKKTEIVNDEVVITDLNGRVMFRGIPSNKRININTVEYKRGLYIATYQYEGSKLQRRFIVD